MCPKVQSPPTKAPRALTVVGDLDFIRQDERMRTAVRPRAARVFTASFALVVTAACTPIVSPKMPRDSSPQSAVSTPSDQTPHAEGSGSIPCRTIDALASAPTNLVVVLDNVALPLRRAIGANPATTLGPGAGLFSKQGLVVRAGVSVELLVPPEWQTRARIGWGNAASPGSVVAVPACPAQGTASWLVFAGGYWVDSPVCFPLLVRTAGREHLVRIGIAIECP